MFYAKKGPLIRILKKPSSTTRKDFMFIKSFVLVFYWKIAFSLLLVFFTRTFKISKCH